MDKPADNQFVPDPAPQDISASISLDEGNRPTNAGPGESSLERLITVVLDSAGVANRSATVAATSTENLLNAVGDLDRMTANTRKQGYVLLGLTLIGTMATVIALTLASTTLNSRVARADATLLAVGKRVVEMNAGTENLQRIETLLSGVEAGGLEALQTRLEQKLDASVAELRKAIAVPPERNAKADEQRMQALLGGLSNQIRNLETQNQLQSRSIARLTEQLGAARQDVAALTRTTSNLETQLQQERSRIAPVAAPPQARPRERRDGPPAGDYIQYPDPQMKKLEIRQ